VPAAGEPPGFVSPHSRRWRRGWMAVGGGVWLAVRRRRGELAC
jgi:hypothetical protein